ncbi:flagellar biosynthesis protein FlhA [Petrotoga olearia]|uniref:Flagellar biosynthesis protein FlhA n=2 Tax=Petrotoga olearia TaxID=156203 RepID=A0A2K1P3N3_9BACT|nr:flagellar biosynthesis protein FlhA [Petrotoga olearia]PNR97384.1 flagellar biosynthesis protein FlhA [Petrotoga olearia DSM 13574]RMA70540.1 flagellar biosynthesis protein FlhA [Petrotoga olearia]
MDFNRIKGLDIVISILIVGIVVLMVIPIPTFLLDFLQLLNIIVSIIILLATLYLKRALDISIFPSLLLVMTIFRLALNVSSTRLILLNGKNFEGKVVRAFGDFVVGGNYVVGIIIFLILVIIQFLVITKGTERISEVAARFTLDAMPGKQMSIDADMSSGLINEEEARQRREDIRREADFYGAMDGASKFVRGDAIAGLIITLINLVGGLIIGMLQQGLTIAEAAEVFALLTVGDGLVAQIPALLISTSAGMIVSRAASKDNFGVDLIRQLTSDTRVLNIAGGIIIILGMLTPIPIFPSLILGGGLLFVAYVNRASEGQLAYETPGSSGVGMGVTTAPKGEKRGVSGGFAPPLTTPEEVSEVLQGDTIEVDIGYGLIPLADPDQGGDLLDRITVVRKQLAYELGMVISPIRIRDSVLLSSNEYIIKLRGVEVGRFELIPDRLLAINSGMASEELPGIKTKEPAFGLGAFWIDESLKEEAIEKGYTTVDAPSVFATHLSETIKKYAHEIIGTKEIEILIDGLRVNYANLVDTLIPTMLKMHELKKVLSELLYERISIRNLSSIFESLIEAVDKYGNNIENLVEYVRRSMGRQIAENLKSDDGDLHVTALDPSIEKKLSESIRESDSGRVIIIEPEYSNILVQRISKSLENMMMKGFNPILICSKNIRYPFARFILKFIQNISIIAYEEIPSDTSLNVNEIVKIEGERSNAN